MSLAVCRVQSKGFGELSDRVIQAWKSAEPNAVMWVIDPKDVDRAKCMTLVAKVGENWWSADSHLLVCDEMFQDMVRGAAIRNMKCLAKSSGITANDGYVGVKGGYYTETFLAKAGLVNGQGYLSAKDIKAYMRHIAASILREIGGENTKRFSDASVCVVGWSDDNSACEVQAAATDIHTGSSVVVNIKKADNGMLEYNLHYLGNEKTQVQGVYMPKTIGCTDLPVELYMAGVVLGMEVNRKRGRFSNFTKVLTNPHQMNFGSFGRVRQCITEFEVADQFGAVEGKAKAVVEAKDMREAMLNGTLPKAKKVKN